LIVAWSETPQGFRIALDRSDFPNGVGVLVSKTMAMFAARMWRGASRKAVSEFSIMSDSGSTGGHSSGLTNEEAREFHRLFMASFFMFTLIAIVAHLLVWNWRPWFPPLEGASLIHGVKVALQEALPIAFSV
jgi:light-harvesting complex 1 beta chain